MVDLSPLSQMDPRWKDKSLGFDSLTIGKYGCLLTCLAMLANGYGFNETPDSLNEKMKNAQGFQGALIIPAVLPTVLPGMIYRDYINCENASPPMKEIDAFLSRGKPVIVEVDYSPDPGLQNHWIILYGKQLSDYLLRDPWPFPVQPGDLTIMSSRYKFAGSPERIIRGVIFLEGGATSPVKSPVVLNKGVRASFPVYASADGLALRSDTVVADYTLIKRIPLGAQLIVLENDQAARAKIGVLNQWLAVLDPVDGTQGYTAAWYVALTPSTVAAAPPASGLAAVQADALVVKTNDEGVALRSKPEFNDATLIKRVPVNTELLCAEPAREASAKIGVLYQWLKVKDVTGAEYYVAAWYVTRASGQAALGVKDQSTGARELDFSGPSATGEPAPAIIRAAIDGLALRSRPLILAETVLKRLSIDSELVVLEPPVTVDRKLGKMGEWMHVRDVEGNTGYVAAWYVTRRPDPVTGPDRPLRG